MVLREAFAGIRDFRALVRVDPATARAGRVEEAACPSGDGFVGGFVDAGKIEHSGNVFRRGEGGRGKREQRKQCYGHTSNEHHRILAFVSPNL